MPLSYVAATHMRIVLPSWAAVLEVGIRRTLHLDCMSINASELCCKNKMQEDHRLRVQWYGPMINNHGLDHMTV